MKILNKINRIKDLLSEEKTLKKTIGFVPTMGALHEGHISLINRAKKENDIVVCSIFVNPIQFNNKEDFNKYPQKIDEDIIKLGNIECDYLFIPSVEEMYPEADNTVFDFGHLDKIMEGKYRPGHFNGVAVVVKKIFEIVEPNKAYFGEKDYQQLIIIKKLVEQYNFDIDVIPCPILREEDGLAMSSRNVRLSSDERKIAPNIFKILNKAKEKSGKISVPELINWVKNEITLFKKMKLEYFEIVDTQTLLPISEWKDSENCIACIVVYVGKIRLIDNIYFF